MIKAPISLQELRRRIYRKAKSEKTHRFWGLFVHITKIETLLEEAYRIAKGNGGAPGIDGQSFPKSAPPCEWKPALRWAAPRAAGIVGCRDIAAGCRPDWQ